MCMVGLSSEKNEASKDIIDYLRAKEIKTCIFANNLTEIQSLKSLVKVDSKNEDENEDYVEL